MKLASVVKSGLFWVSVAFVVLIVLPLYAVLAIVAVRTKLLDLDGDAFTDEQYKAIWTFLGVALGTAATIMGAILTKANNDKNLAEQRVGEDRQKLDTAVQALNLIKQDDKYASPAVTAGALAALVHLGHPTIAMLTTQAALSDDAVTTETAVWLVDQVLMSEHSAKSKADALGILDTLTPQLTRESAPGVFQFPHSAISTWPSGLDESGNYWLLDSMMALLVSREYEWWISGGTTWTWVLYSIDELVARPSISEGPKSGAATYGMRLLTVIGDGTISGNADSRDAAHVRQRLEPLAQDGDWLGDWLGHWDDVCRWCESAAASSGASNGSADPE